MSVAGAVEWRAGAPRVSPSTKAEDDTLILAIGSDRGYAIFDCRAQRKLAQARVEALHRLLERNLPKSERRVR